MLLVDGDVVVAALDILSKDIALADELYAAAGLSTVVTDSARRGQGFGRRLVVAAREAMADFGHDIGLFTCDRPLLSFYESAGWTLLPETVLLGGTPDEPLPSDAPGFDKVTVGAPFSPLGMAGFASFSGARIQLYPGLIDRLW